MPNTCNSKYFRFETNTYLLLTAHYVIENATVTMHTWFKIKKTYCYRADQDSPKDIKKTSLKLAVNKTVEKQEKTLPSPEKLKLPRISDPNDSFVLGDLLRMCTSEKSFSRAQVYEAIQATLACTQKDSQTWVVKLKHPQDGLYFKIASEPKLAK